MSAGSAPYLVAKPDPYDGWSGNPNHTWSTKVTDTRIENAFPRLGNLRRIVVVRRDGNGQWNGRVESMRLVGATSRSPSPATPSASPSGCGRSGSRSR